MIWVILCGLGGFAKKKRVDYMEVEAIQKLHFHFQNLRRSFYRKLFLSRTFKKYFSFEASTEGNGVEDSSKTDDQNCS